MTTSTSTPIEAEAVGKRKLTVERVAQAWRDAGGKLAYAAVLCSSGQERLKTFMMGDPGLRAMLENRAPTEAEVIEAKAVSMALTPMALNEESAAQLQDMENEAFAQALSVMLPRPEMAKAMRDARALTGSSFANTLQSLHGGMFRSFAFTSQERDQWAELLEMVMAKLKDGDEYPVGGEERARLLMEAKIVHAALREIGSELTEVNRVVQNSAIVLSLIKANKGKKKSGF